MEVKINIAIDGPAGAGKSTVAKKLAQRFNYVYVDTGAMYRAITWLAIQTNTDFHNEEELYALLTSTSLNMKNGANGELVLLVNNKEVTEEIRSAEVTGNVSYVAKHPKIRQEMVHKQQEIAESKGTVMDGRDIGTAVLPKAEVKFFLTASVTERAKRRHEEQVKKGMDSDYDTLVKDIAKRDKIDSEREVAPLKKAEDAMEVDTTSMSIDEVVDFLYHATVKRVGQ
ncbi:(d)CMP kinase [Paenalkalicoccus suaedae]|uniref:Cytidylate kinase n=1 Tax=Paenalkalicoccus suaedae TaxID=2592382 RepID=A0A859FER2_9BACI|nr:(d)CMP kinase [Paenalkalicoccus suaedae]QKS71074.1 (d)CMP kinase [Paenalkalicoccus suaedae]